MKREAKNYKVSILGSYYTVISDETETHMLESVAMVDDLVNEIAEKTGSADIKKITILAALQLASRLVHAQHKIEQEHKHQEALMSRINQELAKVLPNSSPIVNQKL